MVLHADHHFSSAVGQKGSVMSSVSATTWDSTASGKTLSTILPRELIEGATNFREIRAGGNLLDRFEVPLPCKLRRVDLFNNKLSGEISDTVRWAPLTHLNLVQNALVGDIPVRSLSQLPLVELYLNHNNFKDPKKQGATLQANLPNCRISVDDYSFSGSPGRAAPLYERVSVDDYSNARPEDHDDDASLGANSRRLLKFAPRSPVPG